MRKRGMALLMAGIMAAGVLAGCSSGAGQSTGGTTTQAAGTSAETEPQAEKQPQRGEKVTLRMIKKDALPEDPTYQEWIRLLNEDLEKAGVNAQLELVSMQSGTYSENLALLLNSGDIPDIIFFQGGDEEFALNQQILEDLTPYIDGSTYIKGMVEKMAYSKTRLSNYPYMIYLSPLSTKLPVIRTDVLDKCAGKDTFMADPTVDNYYQLMKEAKDQGYRAAYTVAGDLSEINNVFDQAFGLTTTWVKGDDGSYIYSRVSSGALEELKFYAKLFQDGLLDNEYASNNWENKENKFYSDGAAIISGTQGDVIDGYNNKQIKAHGEEAVLTVLPPAKGISQGFQPIDVSKETRGFAISALSENKELAFQVMEYVASPEGRILDLLGFEGTHYNVDADGKYELLAAHDNWYYAFFGMTDNLDMNNISTKTPYRSEPGETSLEMFQQYSSDDNNFVIPSEFTVPWDACTSVYNEFAADFVMGSKTEADWDAFVKEWNDAGGSKVTEYANTILK